MTYQIYLNNGGEKVFDEIETPQDKFAVKCACGGLVWPHAMIDVRAFDDPLTGGAQFICSDCYSTWERERRSIDPEDDFLIPEEFQAKFIERKTGYKETGAERVRLEYLEKERIRISEDESRYASAPDDHPDKVALKSKRIELENRIEKG